MPKLMRAPAAPARQRGFFDFSMSELAIIFSVALVVLGPKKLPGLVQQIGRWVGRARHMARQFREQLEQEVNSINEVKPVPRNVAPEVGPAAPTDATTPEAHTDSHTTGTEATGVVENPTLGPEASAALPEQIHPEANIYFAMNGSEPDVVAHNPHDPQVAAAEAQAPSVPAETDPGATSEPAPAAATQIEEAKQPASVEVIFPHDHG
jgi:sec-independent protein translocase protein TatB